ncbi:unnamed protein product [Ectocarpus sp. 13 AM-2016]
MTILAGGVDPENAEETDKKSASDRDSSYVVQRGDTLAGVALRLGVKQSELKRANSMFGSRTLVAGQVLKTRGPVKSVSKEKIVHPVPAEPSPAAQQNSGSASEAGAGAAAASAFAVAVTATMTTPGIAPATAAEEDGILVEPPEEEVWFEDSRGGQAGGAADGTVAASSSSLMAPVEESMVQSAVPGEILYEPPHWGGAAADGGGGVASHSQQGSDASTSAAASVRGMFNYIRSKAAAVVTTPTASDAAGGGSDGFFAGSGGGKISRRNSRQSNGGGSGDTGSHYASSGGGGSMPSTPRYPSVDEGLAPAGLPPAEMWAGTREDPGNAAAFAAAQSAARDVSEVAQSTAQAFLSMVKPSYWRADSEGGGAAGESPVGFGDGRRGERRGSDRWVGVPGGARSFEDTASTGSILHSLADEASLFPGDPGARSSPPPAEAPLKLPGLVCGGSTIVTHSTLARMEAAQPKHHRGYNWYLLYSTYRDGASYTTLYNRIQGEEPTFLIVESMRGEVFGGFATSAWSSGCQYYGTGECFLFKIEGERVSVESEEEQTENDSDDRSADGRTGSSETVAESKTLMEGDMTAFGWTGMNMYLQYSDSKGIAMGGGGADGSFGLFIGEDFLTGGTGKCDTYGNPPLCSQEQFQVSQVEVWGFTTADTEMGARLERLRKTLRGKTTRPL